jgi:hypothetical protein
MTLDDKTQEQHGGIPDRYIGFILAVTSSIFIGASYVITKKGLISSDSQSSYSYLTSKMWWLGMITSKTNFSA